VQPFKGEFRRAVSIRTLRGMDSRDLTVRQLDALFDRLRPMSYYFGQAPHSHGAEASPRRR
jgi:hypothetical protein